MEKVLSKEDVTVERSNLKYQGGSLSLKMINRTYTDLHHVPYFVIVQIDRYAPINKVNNLIL